jgi:hypothetical protein
MLSNGANMTLRIQIVDGRGTGQLVGATPLGELLVAGFGTLNNLSSFRTMTPSNTAFNFFGPIAGQQFIITSIILDGPASTISIYEAASPSTIIIDRLVYKIDLRSATTIAIPFSFGGFLPVSEGEYLNAFTSDATVNMNILGYFHPITTNPL